MEFVRVRGFPFHLGPHQLLGQPLVLRSQLLQRGVLITRHRLWSELSMPVSQALLADAARRRSRLERVLLVRDEPDQVTFEILSGPRHLDDDNGGSTTSVATRFFFMTNFFQRAILPLLAGIRHSWGHRTMATTPSRRSGRVSRVGLCWYCKATQGGVSLLNFSRQSDYDVAATSESHDSPMS